MFTYQELPKIPGYGYIANAPLTPVNWKNASGVTDMKVFVVKKSSDLYKKTYGYQNNNKNDEDKQHHYKARRNEDGLLLDEEGQPIVHDLYHEYRSFLGYLCPGDSAGLPANAHLIYLFEKYFGYNPNLSKKQNYQRMDGQIAQAGKKLQNNATIKKNTNKNQNSESHGSKKNVSKNNKDKKSKQVKHNSNNSLGLIAGSIIGMPVGLIAIGWGISKMRKPHKHQLKK